MNASVEDIDARLPQHQCGRCGYGGCRPYAEAIAAGESDINRCPPGGSIVVGDLARLLGRRPLPLDPEVGGIEPEPVARIDAATCIGCTKCLPACPVDAIAGAPKRLHDVIDAACTGCGLCLEPCPVDCITLEPREDASAARRRLDPPPARLDAARQRLRERAAELRERYARHERRLADSQRRRRRQLDTADGDDVDTRRREIAEAVARVRERRATAR